MAAASWLSARVRSRRDTASHDEPDLGELVGEQSILTLIRGESRSRPSIHPVISSAPASHFECPRVVILSVIVGHPDPGLLRFREGLHSCLSPWGDALFELCDAMCCATGSIGSVPALSMEPVFRRSHGSLYKALALGGIDDEALRSLLLEHRAGEWPLVFAVDSSTFDRRDAATSPDRGFYYSPSKQTNGQRIIAGWSYQWISHLDWAMDSWTQPLDVVRLVVHEDESARTIEQVTRLVTALPNDREVPLFVFDAGYNAIALGHGLREVRCEVLVRISSKRVFHSDPVVPPPGTVGRPRLHGRRFSLSDPKTWPTPDDTLTAEDLRYGTVTVEAWHDQHPRISGRVKGRWGELDKMPIVHGSVLRVEVERLPKPSGRTKKTLWLWWSGTGTPDLSRCWRSYLRRFDIEHTFRFMKGTLGWTTPALRNPEQADRWTWLVLAAYTQLRLSRVLVADLRLPWERRRELSQLTPSRVRRGFRQLRATIGTPAHAPKSITPGPGRPKGTRRPPRTRYPVIRRAA